MDLIDPRRQDLWHEPEHLPAIAGGPGRDGHFFNLAFVRGALVRQAWLVAAVVALALVGGLVLTLLSKPVYEASATVKLEPRSDFIVAGQEYRGYMSDRQVQEYRHTQGSIIESRSLASEVASNLKLGERYDLLGADIDEQRPASMSDEAWQQEKLELAAASLQRGIAVDIPFDTSLITITFQSGDPVLAAEITNGYVDAFLKTETSAEIELNEYGKDFYEEQITLVRERLRNAEREANEYARSNGLVAQETVGSGSNGQAVLTTTGANLMQINSAAAEARADRIRAQQRWRQIENVPPEQLPEVQSNQAVQAMITERSRLETELIDLRQRYNEQFPEIVEKQGRVDSLTAQINRIGNDIKSSIRNDFLIAQRQDQALQSELNSVTEVTLDEQDRKVEYEVYEREAQALRDQLASLLQSYNSLTSASDFEVPSITRVDSARVPTAPIAPSLFKNMMVALFAGLAIAFGLALVRELVDNRIRSTSDIETKIGLPALGLTPFVDPKDEHISGEEPFTSLVESYASIRTAIDFAVPREMNLVQLTSTKASEGKSTTALILAELFARMGRRTLLIDADLRRPSIADLVDCDSSQPGLVEVVLGHATMEQALYRDVHENLEILPMGTRPPNPPDLLSSNALRDFLATCRDQYSIVLIDSPPVLGIADAPILSGLVDATVFVVEANSAKSGDAVNAVKRLRGAGGNIIGAVLTKYVPLKAGQGYGQEYEYYHYGS
ncbi:polysaccharide biosynthesis tyrosine autokinase [Erythrobacter sp. THAF29]|uniref:GumC family protein n=1 Tax=Erythrobacter sp. THAF29 TaxID=2587851 RepID=UPI001562AD8B|nr:polysaccharide biosynthesis tyrosine autokinase [Erythrobacter sp. THAF29]